MASVASCAPCRRLAWGVPQLTGLESGTSSAPKRHAQTERPVNAAAPDAMFFAERSSLGKSASAWWSHMRYILVSAFVVSFALHHAASAIEAKCSVGLDVSLLDQGGPTEITRKWHRCFVPNFDEQVFRPMSDWGSWNVYMVRATRLWSSWSTDNAPFAMMLAWTLSPATGKGFWGKKSDKNGFIQSTLNAGKVRGLLYLILFLIFFTVPLFDYQITGHKQLGSWCVSFTCFIAGLWLFVSDNRLRDESTVSKFSLYIIYCSLGGLTYIFAIGFLNVSGSPRYSITLKLLIRFLVDPMIWEAMKTAQRHIALLSPSPGAGLDVASFMGPIINQSVYSRLLLFMMTNDGAVDLLTVQFVISLNELMMKLTLKHRDAFFTRYTLGTNTADALLAAKKADDIHVSSVLANSFCELASVATLTSFMATFNLPSAPDTYDNNTGGINVIDGVSTLPRTTDYNSLMGQAFRLLAIELCFSFLSAFAQHRFHDIDLRRPFNLVDNALDTEDDIDYLKVKGGTGPVKSSRSVIKPRLSTKIKRVFYGRRLRTYVVMATFFAMCVVGTLLGTLWTVAVCPRVRRSDGHLFFSFCEPTEAKHFPGGPTSQSAGIIGWQFDWPPRMGGNKAEKL